jgi:hypothetical protein
VSWEHMFVSVELRAGGRCGQRKPAAEFALAAKGARPTRQLLPGLSGGLQTPALLCESRALRRERCPAQADHRRGARLIARGVLS